MRFAALGRTEFLLHTVQRLVSEGHELSAVFTGPAEPHYLASVSDFATLAARHSVPFSDAGTLTTADLNMLSETATQVGISVNWPTRLPQHILDAFPQGCLNAHAGDLPRYRGNACLNWAILRREREVAIVVHRMVGERIDEGPILGRNRRELHSDTYIGDLYNWLNVSIPQLFSEVLRQIELKGSVDVLPPNVGPALRCYPRHPSDSKIDWRDPVDDICALVRASSRPFEGAYSSWNGAHFTVWRGSPASVEAWGEYCAVPGQLIRGPSGTLGVATGTTPLMLEEFSVEGVDAMEVREVAGRLAQC